MVYRTAAGNMMAILLTGPRAQRSSRNRAAGTLETKPVNVDNKQHKKMMLEHILPAIVVEQWPAADRKRRVYIYRWI